MEPVRREGRAPPSQRREGETFAAIVRRRLRRRDLLRRGVAGGVLVLMGGGLAQLGAACRLAGGPTTPTPRPAGVGIWFDPIVPTQASHDQLTVAAGHGAEPLLRWGDPIFEDAPAFDPDQLTAASQERQFGYNCDFTSWCPLPRGSGSSESGLLWVNHEYVNPELMFAAFDRSSPTRPQVDYQMSAMGASIVELRRVEGKMTVVRSSAYNRRIAATTRVAVGGPAQWHPWMSTSADPTGGTVLGTLSNCAGGFTPWGTVLTCEENFQELFGNLDRLPDDDPRAAVHRRYRISGGPSRYLWERYYERFDVAREPSEPFRFGWVVEVDPYDPGFRPVKRTALGRFLHEGATFALSPSGRVAFYSGDDAPFEYIYKFVTSGAYSAARPEASRNLLDQGTLYVAKFNDDGTGEWLPLVFGQGALTPERGFASQGDVLLKTRLAADAVGATAMDRAEDIQQNPVNGKIYAALTYNEQRGTPGRPGTSRANPRVQNRWGHVIELTEGGDDVAATTFGWAIFLLCGDPADPTTYFAGFPKERVSRIAAPDNIEFDQSGNLWLCTDGQPDVFKLNNALYVVPTEGAQRGNVQAFLAGVASSELTGPQFTPDNRTLFVSVQHPGEYSTREKPTSHWPDGTSPPRPSVVQVWNTAGGRVGVTHPPAS